LSKLPYAISEKKYLILQVHCHKSPNNTEKLWLEKCYSAIPDGSG
jgi:hypothetical protein